MFFGEPCSCFFDDGSFLPAFGEMYLELGRRDFRTWKKPLQGTFSAGDARYGCFDRAGGGGDV
jgi:hypothetical protein